MLNDIILSLFPFRMNYPLVFGIFMLLGVLGGLTASKAKWLPTISGFMLVGLLMGTQGIGLLNQDVLQRAADLVQISLGLILYKLGCSIHPQQIIRHPKIVFVSLCESFLTFFLIFALLQIFGYSSIVSILVAAIGVSSSPAVLVHVASEMGAKGVVTENAKVLVALNNLISFIIFSMAMPYALYTNESSWIDIFGIPFYRLIVAFFIGTAVAFVVTRVSVFLKPKTFHYIFPLMLGGIMLTLGASMALQASFLFANLVFGMMVRFFEKKSAPITTTDFGYAEDIFYIILFVTAGASLHLQELWVAGWIAILFPLLRCFVKYGVLLGSKKVFEYNFKQASATGMLLMPMAGMAIGLLQTVNQFVPDIGAQVSILVFSAVVVLETIGPPIAKFAFRLSGEADRQNYKDKSDIPPEIKKAEIKNEQIL